jgi:hypothetical protein
MAEADFTLGLEIQNIRDEIKGCCGTILAHNFENGRGPKDGSKMAGKTPKFMEKGPGVECLERPV